MQLTTRRRLLQGVVTTLAGMTCAATPPRVALAQTGITGTRRETIVGLVRQFMDAHTVPGLSVAFGRDGRLIYEQGFGFADVGHRVQVTPAHQFRIASVSKPITACATLGLVEHGRLALGDPVFGARGVLGTTFGGGPYTPHVEGITIEHLLTHTSGGWSNVGNDPMAQRPEWSQADLIAWVLTSVPLAARPGTRYDYSNFGYCVLGRVIEKVTGRPYAQYVREAILDRCGIGDIAIAGSRLSERAANEVEYFGELGDDPYGLNVRRMDAHGGWLATARDLVRFAMHVDGFAAPRDILSPATIRTMTQPSALNAGYAKGWNVNDQGVWWHDGNLPGTMAILVRTSSGLCWAALANTRRLRSAMGRELDRLMWHLSRQLTERR